MVCHLNVFNELYQHLGISAAFKYITFGLKFFFKDGVEMCIRDRYRTERYSLWD